MRTAYTATAGVVVMGDDTADEDVQPVDRVCLNLRVSPSVKEAFEDAIFDEYRAKRPYCGIVLERECRFRLDDSILNDLWDNVDALADAYGQQDRKEKISQPERSDTVNVQYRIAEDVRHGIMQLAEATQYKSAGEFVESIMWRYANDGSREQHLADRTARILHVTEADSAVERRTKTIAYAVTKDDERFGVEDVGHALDNAVQGINDGSHGRKKYLPKVLDELGYTWTSDGNFAPTDAVDTDDRDPREKPYILMDAEDRRLALKYHLYAISTTSSGDTAMIELDDAHTVLDGRPQKTTASQDLRQLGETPGFTFVTGASRTADAAEDGLQIHHRDVEQSDAHRDLKRLLGIDDDEGSQDIENLSQNTETSTTDEPAIPDDPSEQSTSWVDETAATVADVSFNNMDTEQQNTILTGKIAVEKYADPSDMDDEGDFHDLQRIDELRSKVTDDDLDAVRRELGLSPTTEASKEAIEDEVDDEFAALEGADRARADGGRPMK